MGEGVYIVKYTDMKGELREPKDFGIILKGHSGKGIGTGGRWKMRSTLGQRKRRATEED